MGYKRMNVDDLYNLSRRWRADHSLTKIASATRFDQKTVRQYIRKFVEDGIGTKDPRSDKRILYTVFEKIIQEEDRANRVPAREGNPARLRQDGVAL